MSILEQDIKDMNTQIFLRYQPIYYLNEGVDKRIIGYEALLRHPSGQPPLYVLEVARQSNSLFELEMEIFKQAVSCVLMKSPHLLFINISSEAFGDASFAVKVQRMMKKLGVSPSRVCIEIPELNLYDSDKFQASLQNWLNIGFYTAVDDFGSMRSNIDIVFNAKPDYVKVDKFLLNGICKDRRKQKILAGLIEVFTLSGIYPILEGIETPDDLDWVISKGWDIGGQGYLLMHPSDFEDCVTI